MRLLDEQYTRTPFYGTRKMTAWFSRYVLSWEVSITLDTSFCLEALDRALKRATPEIFNSDQGVQFTSAEFTNRLKAAEIRISWDGRGRALDTIFVERVRRCALIPLVGGVQHH
jgi:transposase InsO family protein